MLKNEKTATVQGIIGGCLWVKTMSLLDDQKNARIVPLNEWEGNKIKACQKRCMAEFLPEEWEMNKIYEVAACSLCSDVIIHFFA